MKMLLLLLFCCFIEFNHVAIVSFCSTWFVHIYVIFRVTMQYIISNQIKSLLLSHHYSTCALMSEILESVLQTVQKQFTYRQYILTDLYRRQCQRCGFQTRRWCSRSGCSPQCRSRRIWGYWGYIQWTMRLEFAVRFDWWTGIYEMFRL